MEPHKGKEDDVDDGEKFFSVNYYMVPAKVAYFFNSAKKQIKMYPMLFFITMGLNPAEAGVINGLQYIGGFIGAPLWGFVADKFRIHRGLAISLCVMAAITTCLQPLLGIYFADKFRYKCHIKPNNTLDNSLDEFSHSVNHNILYYSLLFAVIIGKSFDASASSFVDSGCLRRIQTSPKKTYYGQQKYVGIFGVAFGGMAFSISVNYYPITNTSCESGIFLVYLPLVVLLGFASHYLFKGATIETKEREDTDPTIILMQTLKNCDTVFFFSCVLFSGIAQNVFFNFLFLRLKELNAIPLIFGFQSCVVAISGSIVSYVSKSLIEFLGGTMNAMCCSCFVWSLRLLSVSILQNPYYIILIEVCQGLTYSLFTCSAFEHLNEICDPIILSTMCGILHGLYIELSAVIANVIGGQLYYMYGGQNLFLISSAACALWGTLMVCHIIIKHMREGSYQLLNNEDVDNANDMFNVMHDRKK